MLRLRRLSVPPTLGTLSHHCLKALPHQPVLMEHNCQAVKGNVSPLRELSSAIQRFYFSTKLLVLSIPRARR